MLGVVACETLYHELDRLERPLQVEYVPQWYHEYPVHAPASDRIHALLAERVARLEAAGVDGVLVLYHDPAGVAGLRTERTPLHVHEGGDCIDLFLSDAVGRFGERKAEGTYYLTRGLIDVGLDCFKLHAAYAGELDALVERFETARERHPELRVRWPESDRLAAAAARSERMRTDPAALLTDVVRCYHRVVLLDTGTLFPVHFGYAAAFRAFVETVGAPPGKPLHVALEVAEGDTSRLRSLVHDPAGAEAARTYAPGTPVSEPAGTTPRPPVESD